jgi:hypothetical protein
MSLALKLLQNDVILIESCQSGIACAKFVLYEIPLHSNTKTEEIQGMME